MSNTETRNGETEHILSLVEGQKLEYVERDLAPTDKEKLVQARIEAVRFAIRGGVVHTKQSPPELARVIDEYCRQEWGVHQERFAND